MAHIIFGSKLKDDLDLGDQLRSWGATSGARSFAPGSVAWPDVWTCDCVLISSAEWEDLTLEDRQVSDKLRAPVLVWDGQEVAAPDLTGQPSLLALATSRDLYGAVQICLAHAECLRDCERAVPILEDNPLRVIGHELLTPLAAIKTALESLDQGCKFGKENSEQRIVALAIRNVERLEAAVDWSESLSRLGSARILQNTK